MKKYFLISVFTFLFVGLFSQDTVSHQTDSAGILKIERIVKGKPVDDKAPYYIYTGQRIMIRTFSNHHPQSGILTGVNENSLVMDYTREVAFSEIKEITWDCESRTAKLGQTTCYVAGGALIAGGLALYGNVLINNYQFGDGKLLLAVVVGTPMIFGGFILVVAGAAQTGISSQAKKQFPRHWKISAANTGSMSRHDVPKTEKEKPRKSKVE